jgi:outer membrane biosynthesis protein TonB
MSEAKVVMLLLASAILTGCPSSATQQGGGELGGGDPTDPASTRGGVTFEQMEEIKRVERIGQPGITACYTDELERRNTKKLEGKVVVKIQIGTNGSALQVTIGESTLNAPLVHQCMQEQIRKWEFPKVASPTWYGTTFHFSPAY